MAPEDERDLIEAVVTCEGNLHDPDFSARFQCVVSKLKNVLYATSKDQRLKVQKIEPWNSVRVTISIPKDAAQRLRLLAQEGSMALRQMGILSVQVEGDQIISLTLAGREPQQVGVKFGDDASSTPGPSSAASTPGTSGPSGNMISLDVLSSTSSAFRSPNVIAPVGESIPMMPPKTSASGPRTALSGPFPFASMAHAAHTARSDSVVGSVAAPLSSSTNSGTMTPVTGSSVGASGVKALKSSYSSPSSVPSAMTSTSSSPARRNSQNSVTNSLHQAKIVQDVSNPKLSGTSQTSGSKLKISSSSPFIPPNNPPPPNAVVHHLMNNNNNKSAQVHQQSDAKLATSHPLHHSRLPHTVLKATGPNHHLLLNNKGSFLSNMMGHPLASAGKPRQVLINPLTGHLEPMQSDGSGSEGEGVDEKPDGKVRNPVKSSKSKDNLLSGAWDRSSLSQPPAKAIKLTIDPTKLNRTSPAHPIFVGSNRKSKDDGIDTPPKDISVAGQMSSATEKVKKIRLKLEKAGSTGAVPPLPSTAVSSSLTTGSLQGTGSSVSVEVPRVPPLHISLRGKNAAVVVSPRRDEIGKDHNVSSLPEVAPTAGALPVKGVSVPVASKGLQPKRNKLRKSNESPAELGPSSIKSVPISTAQPSSEHAKEDILRPRLGLEEQSIAQGLIAANSNPAQLSTSLSTQEVTPQDQDLIVKEKPSSPGAKSEDGHHLDKQSDNNRLTPALGMSSVVEDVKPSLPPQLQEQDVCLNQVEPENPFNELSATRKVEIVTKVKVGPALSCDIGAGDQSSFGKVSAPRETENTVLSSASSSENQIYGEDNASFRRLQGSNIPSSSSQHGDRDGDERMEKTKLELPAVCTAAMAATFAVEPEDSQDVKSVVEHPEAPSQPLEVKKESNSFQSAIVSAAAGDVAAESTSQLPPQTPSVDVPNDTQIPFTPCLSEESGLSKDASLVSSSGTTTNKVQKICSIVAKEQTTEEDPGLQSSLDAEKTLEVVHNTGSCKESEVSVVSTAIKEDVPIVTLQGKEELLHVALTCADAHLRQINLSRPSVTSLANSAAKDDQTGAAEDSGIDSMDALSEKSPNQGESPARKPDHDHNNFCDNNVASSQTPRSALLDEVEVNEVSCRLEVQVRENKLSSALTKPLESVSASNSDSNLQSDIAGSKSKVPLVLQNIPVNVELESELATPPDQKPIHKSGDTSRLQMNLISNQSITESAPVVLPATLSASSATEISPPTSPTAKDQSRSTVSAEGDDILCNSSIDTAPTKMETDHTTPTPTGIHECVAKKIPETIKTPRALLTGDNVTTSQQDNSIEAEVKTVVQVARVEDPSDLAVCPSQLTNHIEKSDSNRITSSTAEIEVDMTANHVAFGQKRVETEPLKLPAPISSTITTVANETYAETVPPSSAKNQTVDSSTLAQSKIIKEVHFKTMNTVDKPSEDTSSSKSPGQMVKVEKRITSSVTKVTKLTDVGSIPSNIADVPPRKLQTVGVKLESVAEKRVSTVELKRPTVTENNEVSRPGAADVLVSTPKASDAFRTTSVSTTMPSNSVPFFLPSGSSPLLTKLVTSTPTIIKTSIANMKPTELASLQQRAKFPVEPPVPSAVSGATQTHPLIIRPGMRSTLSHATIEAGKSGDFTPLSSKVEGKPSVSISVSRMPNVSSMIQITKATGGGATITSKPSGVNAQNTAGQTAVTRVSPIAVSLGSLSTTTNLIQTTSGGSAMLAQWLPSGHKIMPIKLVTIPKQTQSQLQTIVGSTRASPNVVENFNFVTSSAPRSGSASTIVKAVSSASISANAPTVTSELSALPKYMVPISVPGGASGVGSAGNPVKVLVSSPVKVQQNLLQSVMMRGQIVMSNHGGNAQPTTIRVVRPIISAHPPSSGEATTTGDSRDFRPTTDSAQKLKECITPTPVTSSLSHTAAATIASPVVTNTPIATANPITNATPRITTSGAHPETPTAPGSIAATNITVKREQEAKPVSTAHKVAIPKKSDARSPLYERIDGVEILEPADVNEEELLFEPDIIHDEKDLEDILAGEGTEVEEANTAPMTNGNSSVAEPYDFAKFEEEERIPSPIVGLNRNGNGKFKQSVKTRSITVSESNDRTDDSDDKADSPIPAMRSSSPLYTYSNRTGRNSHSGSDSGSPSPPEADVHGEDQEIIDCLSRSPSQPKLSPQNKPLPTLDNDSDDNESSAKAPELHPDHTYVVGNCTTSARGNDAIAPQLEQLSIEIPTSDLLSASQVSGGADEGKKHIRHTRSNTRLNSPDLPGLREKSKLAIKMETTGMSLRNSPKPSPTGSFKSHSPSSFGSASARASPIQPIIQHMTPSAGMNSPTGQVGRPNNTASNIVNNKRKRQESDSSSASKEESNTEDSKTDVDLNARPGKRKCSENAAELIKACIGVEDTPKRNMSLVKKMEAQQHQQEIRQKEAVGKGKKMTLSTINDDNEEDLDPVELLARGRVGDRSSRGSSEDRSSSRGSSAQRSLPPKAGSKSEESKDSKASNRAINRVTKDAKVQDSKPKKEGGTTPTGRRSKRGTPAQGAASPVKTRTNIKKDFTQTPTGAPQTEKANTSPNPENGNPRRKTRSSAGGMSESGVTPFKRRRISKDTKT